MPRLDVRVCAARKLPDVQTFGKIDPYVTIELEGKRYKTDVRDNCENPTWEEVFKFNVADDNSAQVKFSLWNKNLMSDDFLGCYTMSISGLTRGVEEEKWVLLQQCKGNAELEVRLLAHDFGQLPAGGTAAPQAEAPPQQASYPAPSQAPSQAPPASYPAAQPSYPAPAPPQQPGYPAQPSYPAQQPGYPAQSSYPQPGVPVNGFVYELVPRHSPGCVVDVAGGGVMPGTEIHLWNPLNIPNQKFRAVDCGMGYFSFTPMHAEHLALAGNSAQGGVFTLQPRNPGDMFQQWRIAPTDSGFGFLHIRGNEAFVMDCQGAGAAPGTKITAWTPLPGAAQQQFMFRQTQ